ncbi:outer membrane beta-barrel protein [Acetobacteroides hydrogenigenes]|uniref:Outer membrane protein with beta-barrel domain n=1 Tax=Acetobacteroides hydrogenigenes TaxID=979970 RepID=A0A4R2EBW6_9BACT|nr:outer membrane beta-barrel protein [Acetobacteroides hydrogenigenes]TCN65367.1 outer membrane protein with beta-barrel domain [Acetobacteroides hydrogenigenes]
MKQVLLTAMLAAMAFASFAQESDKKEESTYYLDISVGYNISLPPFSNAKTDAVFLKPRSGGSMSFGFVRKITDEWGLQVEVLTTTFKVKDSDLADAYGSGVTLSKIDIDPYRSTFFGVGGVTFLPIMRHLTFDVKGSVGINLVEFAKQNFNKLSQTGNVQTMTVSAKRSLAPGALLGARLRYPIGESVDIGIKVEYGISFAKFTDVQRRDTSSLIPEEQISESLPNEKKTVSYLNTGLTLGLRF